MPSPQPFGKRLSNLTDLFLGREPAGEVAPTRPGTDPASKRHFLALVIGTLAIMTVGLLVAYFDDGESGTSATPTVITTPSPAGARTDTAFISVLPV